jgi:hypothetical protein
VMAEIGETSSRDKADITGADHGDAHKSSASSDAIGEMTRRPRQQHGSARRLHPHERDF